MTTSFRARFPISAIKNIKVFGQEDVSPAEWAKRELSGLKVGDVIVCFNPFSSGEGAAAELEASALILVFNVDQPSPSGVLLTDDFYVIGTIEAILRERAVAAAARGSNFSFVPIPYTGFLSEEAKKILSGMSRWGSGGTRANPMHNLPDPLVSFAECLGVLVPVNPIVGIGSMAQALIKGVLTQDMPDFSHKYSIVMKNAEPVSPPQISSVTVIEPDAPAAATSQTPLAAEPPASKTAASKPVTPPAKPVDLSAANQALANLGKSLNSPQDTPAISDQPAAKPAEPTLAQGPAAAPQSQMSTRLDAANRSSQQDPAARLGSIDPASWSSASDRISQRDPSLRPSQTDASSRLSQTDPSLRSSYSDASSRSSSGGWAPNADPAATPASDLPPVPGSSGPAADASSETGFLSIRKRLEARLSGRMPKSNSTPVSDAISVPRSETTTPVGRLVSNIRQQMSIASDNLEYRVSTLKSKMLDRLVSCKHNLSEKEQTSLKALEDLRIQMQNKMEATANLARNELSKSASEGTGKVRAYQSRAAELLAQLLAEQEKSIAQSADIAKRDVTETLATTKEELNKTVSRAQHTLRGLVTTTEVNLNQVLNQCAEGMNERIEGFRAQTHILAEGIGLSVESLGEAAKLQAYQSEEEVMKRLEATSEESLKSLREQSVKAEMECSKLIDKLSRDKLVPALQEKRRIVVELAAFFHDEFSGAMNELLENRLAEFEPIVRSNNDACASALQDFKSRWTTNLEQHQKDLDEIEVKLRDKVEEHLASSKARIDSMQDITRVTDHVLTSPELIRTRDETCLKFDIIAREHVSRAYNLTGDKVQSYKQESIDELKDLRERSEAALRARGDESRTRIRSSIKVAMQRIQDLQSKYTS